MSDKIPYFGVSRDHSSSKNSIVLDSELLQGVDNVPHLAFRGRHVLTQIEHYTPEPNVSQIVYQLYPERSGTG